MIRTDVLIVGGGPAGAACAWALRRHGCDVLILDRVAFPRPKLCAGWITPDIWEELACDAADYPYGLTTLRHLVLSGWGLHVRLPARQLAIRRIEFDHWLLRRSGARVITHHVRDIVRREGGYVVDESFFGRYLVGAGGTHCPVARAYFTDVNPRSPDALIVTQEEEFSYPYQRASRSWRASRGWHDGWGDACHLWFFQHGLPGYAWYVPKVGGIVNVGVGGKAETLKARGDTILRHWEHLVTALATLGLVQDYAFNPRGHAYYVRPANHGWRERQLRVDNAFVVGDAAGLATADMGEGIAPAIRSGLLVADAIATGNPIDVRKIRRWSQPPLIARLLARAYG
jgi:flavin-dependent dehydrogenase